MMEDSGPPDLDDDPIQSFVDSRLRGHLSYLAIGEASPRPFPVSGSHGLYLIDDWGRQYLDFASYLSPLGHNHVDITGSVIDHAYAYGATAAQGQHLLRWPISYAEQISSEFPSTKGHPRILYCEGERAALVRAIDLALYRSGSSGNAVAVLDTGWHEWLPIGQAMIVDPERDGIDSSRIPGALLLSVLDSSALPVPRVREWILSARQHQVPVIVDESVTGFGRTGMMWGQEHTGLIADLTVLGGPLGGGLPLGAVVGDPSWFTAPLEPLSPHSGHPWACAAGESMLKTIRNGVVDHVNDCGQALSESLDELARQFPDKISGHHGVGLFRGLNLKVDPEDFRFRAWSRGLHLGPPISSTVILAPALVCSVSEARRGIDLMSDVLMSWDDDES